MGREGEEGEAGLAVLPPPAASVHHHHHGHHHHLHHHHHGGSHHHHHHHARAEGQENERDRNSRQQHGHDQQHKKRSRSRSPTSPCANGSANASGSKPSATVAAAASPASKKAKPSVALSFGEELAEEEAGVAHVKRSVEEVTAARLKEEEKEKRKAAASAAGMSGVRGLAQAMGLGPLSIAPQPEAGKAKSLQILDDEPDALGGAGEDGLLAGSGAGAGLLPLPVCVAQAAQSRGPKAAMEDRHTIVAALGSGATLVEDPTPVTFVGVYDGHCGALAAEVAAAELHRFLEPHTELLGGAAGAGDEERVARATALMKEAYARTETMLLARLRREGNRQDGAAAVTAAVAGRHLYVANVGDCRCVLGTQTDDNGIRATRLSIDHKPNLPEEKLRVQRAGGSVDFSGVWRVAHQAIPMRLAVSRALGDPAFKRRSNSNTKAFSAGRAWLVGQDGSMTTRRSDGEAEEDDEAEAEAGSEPLVSPVPYVHCRELADDDLVIVLASDGVFDALTDEEAVRMAVEAIRRHPSHPPAAHPLRRGAFRPTEMGVREAADVLVNTALMRGSYDNCTAAVIALQQPQHMQTTQLPAASKQQ